MGKKNITEFSKEVLNLMPYLVRGMFKKHKDQLGRGQISLPQFLSLDLIDTYGAVKMKDIARELNISLPAATGIIERLHHSGLVRRVANPFDRRVIKIVLTPKGKGVLENTRRVRRRAIEDVFSCLTENERRQYLGILRKLKNAMYGGRRKK